MNPHFNERIGYTDYPDQLIIENDSIRDLKINKRYFSLRILTFINTFNKPLENKRTYTPMDTKFPFPTKFKCGQENIFQIKLLFNNCPSSGKYDVRLQELNTPKWVRKKEKKKKRMLFYKYERNKNSILFMVMISKRSKSKTKLYRLMFYTPLMIYYTSSFKVV